MEVERKELRVFFCCVCTGPLEGLKIRGEGAVSNKMLPLALVKIGLTDLPKNGVRVRGGGACAPRPNGSDRTECM